MQDSNDWIEQAKCRGMDTELFYPERQEFDITESAKAICATCPVVDECLEYALVNGERFGIWGGKSEKQRKLLRRQRGIRFTNTTRNTMINDYRRSPGRPPRDICGTPAGYEKHRRNHEPSCDPCREANRLKTIMYRARGRTS